jgi:hypothetical protein
MYDLTNDMTTTMSGLPCLPWTNFPLYSSMYYYDAALPNLCGIGSGDMVPWCFINEFIYNGVPTGKGTREACMIPCTREYQCIYSNSE